MLLDSLCQVYSRDFHDLMLLFLRCLYCAFCRRLAFHVTSSVGWGVGWGVKEGFVFYFLRSELPFQVKNKSNKNKPTKKRNHVVFIGLILPLSFSSPRSPKQNIL